MPQTIELTYEDFRDLAIAKDLRWQMREDAEGYEIFAFDNVVEYRCELWKSDSVPDGDDEEQNATDLADFLDNYANTVNSPSPLKIDPVAEATISFRGDSVYANITAGQTANIDYAITESRLMNGGHLFTDDSAERTS